MSKLYVCMILYPLLGLNKDGAEGPHMRRTEIYLGVSVCFVFWPLMAGSDAVSITMVVILLYLIGE